MTLLLLVNIVFDCFTSDLLGLGSSNAWAKNMRMRGKHASKQSGNRMTVGKLEELITTLR